MASVTQRERQTGEQITGRHLCWYPHPCVLGREIAELTCGKGHGLFKAPAGIGAAGRGRGGAGLEEAGFSAAVTGCAAAPWRPHRS